MRPARASAARFPRTATMRKRPPRRAGVGCRCPPRVGELASTPEHAPTAWRYALCGSLTSPAAARDRGGVRSVRGGTRAPPAGGAAPALLLCLESWNRNLCGIWIINNKSQPSLLLIGNPRPCTRSETEPCLVSSSGRTIIPSLSTVLLWTSLNPHLPLLIVI